MADYHPIDVRYKGPSTAYRGSKRKDAVVVSDGPWARAPTEKPKPRMPRGAVRKRRLWPLILLVGLPLILVFGPISLYLTLFGIFGDIGLGTQLNQAPSY